MYEEMTFEYILEINKNIRCIEIGKPQGKQNFHR